METLSNDDSCMKARTTSVRLWRRVPVESIAAPIETA